MLQEFTAHINKNFPFLKDKKLLIAISGGLDSVVLTQLLNQMKYTVSLAHCNFTLREKESDIDEEFVKNLSQKSYNQIFIKKFDTNSYSEIHKISTQIAARNLRYAWFDELVTEHNFDYVLTAHHADDNLETFLINLTRGTGLEGFTGIPEMNGNIIRPLLPFSRDEILAYANKNNLKWREDASNASTKYIRNKIRHKVVPILKEINPSLLTSFANTLHNLQESQQIVDDRIQEVSKNIIESDATNIIKINIEKTNTLTNPKAYLYQLLKPYNFTEWNDVYNLLSAQSGKQVFSKTHLLLKDRDFLLLSKKSILEKESLKKEYEVTETTTIISEPIHLKFEKVQKITTENKNTIYVDTALLTYPLRIRKWQNGDVFYPKGMQGKKKISKYFKDEKLSLLAKENTWLLCNAGNEIIWIVNYRQDNRFDTATKSTEILKISS